MEHTDEGKYDSVCSQLGLSLPRELRGDPWLRSHFWSFPVVHVPTGVFFCEPALAVQTSHASVSLHCIWSLVIRLYTKNTYKTFSYCHNTLMLTDTIH